MSGWVLHPAQPCKGGWVVVGEHSRTSRERLEVEKMPLNAVLQCSEAGGAA